MKGRKRMNREEERKRIDDEQKRVEEMRMREERKVEKKWRWQEVWERRRKIIKRKYFVCRGFGHIAHHCRNMESRQEERPRQRSLNKFEILRSIVMNIGEKGREEISKDRKTILKEERLKKEKSVKV